MEEQLTMRDFLNKVLPFSKAIVDSGHPDRYKLLFLNSVFLFAGVSAFGLSFVRWNGSDPLLAIADLIFSAIAFFLLYYLNNNKDKIEILSSFALFVTYLLFFTLYLIANDNPARISLFFLLSASAFFLQGAKKGKWWLYAILIGLMIGHFVPYFETKFSTVDIITVTVYLFGLFFILENYELLKDEQALILQESDKRFKTLFEQTPDPAWLIKNHTFTDANLAAAHALGYENINKLLLVHPSKLSPEYQPDGELSYLKAERYMAIAEEKGIYHFEWSHCRKDGSEFPVEITLSAITLHNEPVLYCIWRDISERKQAESLLLRNIERNNTLVKITTETVGMSEKELVTFTLNQAEKLSDSKIAFLHYCNTTDSIDVWSDNDQNESPTLVDPKLWHDSYHSGKAVIQNTLHDLNLISNYNSKEIFLSRYMTIPVFSDEQLVMILGVLNKSDYYNKDLLNELELLANHLWLLIQKKRNLQELELNSQVFHSSNEGIVITDSDNNIVSINDAFCKMSGYKTQELIGKNPNILKSDRQDEKFYQAMWKDISATGQWHGEIWNLNKEGNLYPEWLSISAVKDSNNNIINYIAMHSDMTEYKAAEEKIRYLAHFDPLTKLPNRTLLHDRANVALAHAKRNKTQLALLFLDLDRFKNINDSLGHNIGDKLLKALAKRLNQSLRGEDTISRTGGDEFIAILPNTDFKAAAKVAAKLLKSISQPFDIQKHHLNVTISIGLALFPENGHNFDELSRNADTALYRAKQSGRNKYQFFNEEMYLQARKIQRIENDLRQAIDNDELRLYYQPQVNSITGKITGAEALIRWQHPKLGLVSPDDFIPIAEDSGMIIDIGDWVMRTAVKQIASWKDAGLPAVNIAVNVSQPEFRQHNFVGKVAEILQEFNVGAELLDLEITESIAADNIDETIEILNDLHALGIKLSIDDFGTGYSSLSCLRQFKVHKLKIDQSFIRELTLEKGGDAIVLTIIDLAKNLGLKTIAEGVETLDQLKYLQSKKCDEIQGYLYSKPVPVKEFEDLLKLTDLKIKIPH